MSIAVSPKIQSLFRLAASSPKPNRRYQSNSGTFSAQKPKRLHVKWIKYRNQEWCRLNTLNLDKVTSQGVYVIWQPSRSNSVVRIGQGDVASHLQMLRNSPDVTRFGNDLMATWASVHTEFRDGVERYLYEQFSPLSGERISNGPLVYINLPGKS